MRIVSKKPQPQEKKQVLEGQDSDTLLYCCPSCGASHYETEGDERYCAQCGYVYE